jgi:hypothetical protein
MLSRFLHALRIGSAFSNIERLEQPQSTYPRIQAGENHTPYSRHDASRDTSPRKFWHQQGAL